MKPRILAFIISVILGISTIVVIAISVQEHEITIVDVYILPGSANPDQEENISPKVINVVIGVNNTVRWNNIDDTPRTLTPDRQYDGFSQSIGILLPGEYEERKFEKPRIYDYHGEPGPWITGTVIVHEP